MSAARRNTMGSGGEAKPTFYLHIEKTAGTSVRSLIQHSVPPAGFCHAYHQRDLEALDLTGTRFRMFCGHFRYETLAWFLRRPFELVTFLREPLARTISHLRHLKRHPELAGPLGKAVPIRQRSLAQLSREPVIRRYLANFQVKKLALPYDPEGITAPRTLFDERAVVNETMLDLASERLETARFVGTVEHIARDLPALCTELGVPAPEAVPQLNTRGAHDETLAPADLEPWYGLLRHDIALYRYATETLRRVYA